MSSDDLSAVILFDPPDDPDLRAIAAALRAELGAEPDDDEPASAIALPVADDVAPRLDGARLAVALDARSVARAREAGVARVALFVPRFALDDDGARDADLVLVTNEALVDEARQRGIPVARVRDVGPVAPDGWSPVEDRAALRASLGPRADAPWIVVRADALEDDPAAALVQLSLVGADAVFLFDVGHDPALARALRRRVPAYGLDALMFADAEALRCYRAADAVLGRIDGPEAIRAIAVGAAFAGMPAKTDQLRVAHALETAGLVDVADALATLAVTLDRVLSVEALEAARSTAARHDAGHGAHRVADAIRQLARGEIATTSPSGLPTGLERLSEPDQSGPREEEPQPPPKKADQMDQRVDAELAALRRKLGL